MSGFKDWEGIVPSREKLVNHIQSMLEFERLVRDPGISLLLKKGANENDAN